MPDRFSNVENEVIVATRRDVEANFMFDPLSHRLKSLEMYPDSDSDPCEVFFEDYEVDGELTVPGTIKFLHGISPISSITISKIEFLENETDSESLPASNQ